MPDLKQALKDFVATSNSGKYADEKTLLSKFPELQGYDMQTLRDFVATSNSGKYATEEEVFSKFPEFKFSPVVKKKSSSDSGTQKPPQETTVSPSADGSSATQKQKPYNVKKALATNTLVPDYVMGKLGISQESPVRKTYDYLNAQASNATTSILEPLDNVINTAKNMLIDSGEEDGNDTIYDDIKKAFISQIPTAGTVQGAQEVAKLAKKVINSALPQDAKNQIISKLNSASSNVRKGMSAVEEYRKGSIPDNVFNNVVGGIIGFIPDIVAAAYIGSPAAAEGKLVAMSKKATEKSLPVIAKYAPKAAAFLERAAVAPMTKIFTAKGAVKGMAEADVEEGENMYIEGIKEAAKGFGEGIYMHGLGEIAGRVSPTIAKQITKLRVNNAIASELAMPLANAGVFTTARALRTGIEEQRLITPEEAAMEAGMGIGFSLLHVGAQYKGHKELDHYYENVIKDNPLSSFSRILNETKDNLELAYDPTLTEADIKELEAARNELKEAAIKEVDLKVKKTLGDEALKIQNKLDAHRNIKNIVENKDALIRDINNNESISQEAKDIYTKKISAIADHFDMSEYAIRKRELNTKIIDLEKELESLSNGFTNLKNPSDRAELKVKIDQKRAELESLSNELTDFVTNKSKEDAIQKQSTTEIPVQSETGVSETMETGAPKTELEITPEQEEVSPSTKVSDALTDPIGVYVYDGQKGQLTAIGKTLVLDTPDGFVDIISDLDSAGDATLEDLGISKEAELDIFLNEDNSVEVNGKKYVNNYSDPESAFNRDKDGNYTVSLETEDGQKRTFRGQQADQIVYETRLKNFEQNGTEQQIEQAHELADEAIRIEEEARAAAPKRAGKPVRKAKQRTLKTVKEPLTKAERETQEREKMNEETNSLSSKNQLRKVESSPTLSVELSKLKEQKESIDDFYERYLKAKADNTNPELVSSVDKLLTTEISPFEGMLKPGTEVVFNGTKGRIKEVNNFAGAKEYNIVFDSNKGPTSRFVSVEEFNKKGKAIEESAPKYENPKAEPKADEITQQEIDDYNEAVRQGDIDESLISELETEGMYDAYRAQEAQMEATRLGEEGEMDKYMYIHNNLGRIKPSDFDQYGDRNVRKDIKGFNIKYGQKNATPLDARVQEMSEQFGSEITPQDVIDYIMDRESNPEKYQKSKAKLKKLNEAANIQFTPEKGYEVYMDLKNDAKSMEALDALAGKVLSDEQVKIIKKHLREKYGEADTTTDRGVQRTNETPERVEEVKPVESKEEVLTIDEQIQKYYDDAYKYEERIEEVEKDNSLSEEEKKSQINELEAKNRESLKKGNALAFERAKTKPSKEAPKTEPKAEAKTNDALKDVESTTKALSSDKLSNDTVDAIEDLYLRENGNYKLFFTRIGDSLFFKTKGLDSKNLTKQILIDKGIDPNTINEERNNFLSKNENLILAEAYHKAKKDGSNPELVKELEELLAPKEAAPEIKELLELDTKDKTNLEKVSDFLGKIDRALDNDPNALNDASGVIFKGAAKVVVKTLKALVDAGVTLQKAIERVSEIHSIPASKIIDALDIVSKLNENRSEKISEMELPGYNKLSSEIDNMIKGDEKIDNVLKYVQGSDAYKYATDVQKELLVRAVRKRFGLREKSAPSVGKLFGTIKDIKKVTMTEKAAFVKQIKDLARGAKDAKVAINKATQELAKEVGQLVKSGKITVKQERAILNKFSKVNVLSDKSVKNFTDYMAKVFENAEYAAKLSEANGLKSSISELSNNKDKNPNLRNLGKKFLQIKPSMVDNIYEYNEMAAKIKEAIAGSKIRKANVKFAETVRIDDAVDYVNKVLEKQAKKERQENIDDIQDLLGVDATEFSAEEIEALLKSDKELSKDDEKIVRAAIQKGFDVYSTMVKDLIETRKDVFTGEDIALKAKSVEIVEDFMNMDLSALKPKEALAAVDSLNNFLSNHSTAKMKDVLAKYTGRKLVKEFYESGKKGVRLRKLGSTRAARILAEGATTMPVLFEKIFKGATEGLKFGRASGFNDIVNGRAVANNKVANVVRDYIKKFYDRKANGEKFNTAYNDAERGIASDLARSVMGTEEQIQKEFERRKRILEESIDALSTGTKEQVSKSEVYQKVYDKIVKGSENAEQVMSKVDPVNREAIEDWKEIHENNFEELSDYMLNIHNTLLEKEINYSSPDRYLRIEQGAEKDLAENQAMYGRAGEYLYQREASGLMKAEHPENLPKNKYRDYSFDKNNVESLHDSLVDMNTGYAIRQLDAFRKSDYFKKIIKSSEDRELLNRRFELYVSNIRNKSSVGGEDLQPLMKALDRVGTIGVGMALGSPTQSLKQVVPVMVNTLANAGRLDLGAAFNPAYNNWLNNIGYSIGNRGVESQGQIDSLNKKIETASNNVDLLKAVENANKWWLKTFLVKPDVFIARASFQTYYESYLKKNGLMEGKKVDYENHKVNKDAADYAQMMVDRQQNVSDHELSGSWFTTNKPDRKMLSKIFLNFASFRMNQSARLASDLSTLGHWSTSTTQDKAIAASSIAGFAAEMAMFKLMSAGISIGLGTIANNILGKNESEKEKEKRMNGIYKAQATSAFTDTFSPAPFLDIPVKSIAAPTLQAIEDATGVPVSIYGSRKEDYVKSLGGYGIAPQRAMELWDIITLGSTGKYKDDFGKEQKISEKNRETIQELIPFKAAATVGLLPSDVSTGINNVAKAAKKASGDSMTKEEMKTYNPNLYERMYGNDSRGARLEEREKAMKDRLKEREDRFENRRARR
jgi:hypothetical protein